MTRPEASARLLTLGFALPGLAGAHLVEAGHVLARGTAEQRANVVRAIARMAGLLRVAGGEVADGYGLAARIAAEVGL